MPIDLAIDFGTSKTVLLSGNKILLEQPSVATVDSETWEPICFGERAKNMIGPIVVLVYNSLAACTAIPTITSYHLSGILMVNYFLNYYTKILTNIQ